MHSRSERSDSRTSKRSASRFGASREEAARSSLQRFRAFHLPVRERGAGAEGEFREGHSGRLALRTASGRTIPKILAKLARAFQFLRFGGAYGVWLRAFGRRTRSSFLQNFRKRSPEVRRLNSRSGTPNRPAREPPALKAETRGPPQLHHQIGLPDSRSEVPRAAERDSRNPVQGAPRNSGSYVPLQESGLRIFAVRGTLLQELERPVSAVPSVLLTGSGRGAAFPISVPSLSLP